MKINGYEFEHICDIKPARSTDESFRDFMPQDRYQNSKNLPLNKYGAGPFCKFKIPSRFRIAGVYVVTIDDEVRYVGECKNLSARFNAGYLAKWLNPSIGDVSLMDVKNGVLKGIVEKLSTAGLSPKSVRNVVQVVTMVKSSAVDEDGNEIYAYKWNFEFAQVPLVENQRTPMFTGEEITKLIAKAEGARRMAFTLLAASGLRAGELFGLEVKHFAGNTLSIEQSVWEGRKQTPKTKNARREVDLHPSVATLLQGFIGHRKDGFIFRSEEGTPIHQSNFLRRYLHPLLEQLGIEKQGFHGFRRFRVTHLESSTVPPALVKYWTGNANSSDGEVVRRTVTDRYVMMAKDTKFRAEVAERIGLGFELRKAETVEVVPSVPNSQESEVVVSV